MFWDTFPTFFGNSTIFIQNHFFIDKEDKEKSQKLLIDAFGGIGYAIK